MPLWTRGNPFFNQPSHRTPLYHLHHPTHYSWFSRNRRRALLSQYQRPCIPTPHFYHRIQTIKKKNFFFFYTECIMLDFIKKNKIIILSILAIIGLLVWFFYPSATLPVKELESIQTPDYPPIKRYEQILTPKECQQIIDTARPRLKRSTLGVKIETGEERTSYQVWLKKTELPCLERCAAFVSRVTGMPVENQEDWQVLRYEPGQQYTPHYDACSKTTKEYKDCVEDEIKRGWGKRVYTFFIYLNDVEEGGETYFPQLNLSFKPKQGSAIFWHNLTHDRTEAHPKSQHAGMPVIKGVKWAVNVWIRERAEKI